MLAVDIMRKKCMNEVEMKGVLQRKEAFISRWHWSCCGAYIRMHPNQTDPRTRLSLCGAQPTAQQHSDCSRQEDVSRQSKRMGQGICRAVQDLRTHE